MAYKFDIYDYIVLILILVISIVIGFYHAISARYGHKIKSFLRCRKRKVTTDEPDDRQIDNYLIAGGRMTAFPIALSLLASFFSATALLGLPAEVYQYGIEYWIYTFGILFTPVVAAYITGPMFARLGCVSVFEYLKYRYNSNFIRLIATTCYVIRSFISAAIYIYGPATTITALTNISEISAVLIIGCVATFYTTIGGIKAVIWTDVFQMTIMLVGLIAVFSKGTSDVGGLGEVFRINSEGGRLNFFDFNPDPFTRQNFWSLTFGTFVYFFGFYGIDQQMLQRFQAAKSRRHAQAALLLNIPGILILLTFCCFSGLVIYANYANCDPLSAPDLTNVKSPNQLMVYLVTDKMKSIKGFTGLFVSSILSGSLSSVSSSLNSMAAIIWQDFLKNFSFFNNMNDSNSTITVKILVIIIGVVATCVGIVVSQLGGNLIQLSNALNGAFNSPIVGVFVIASIPFTDVYGAFAGMLFGFGMGAWLSYGTYVMKPVYPKLGVNAACYLNETLNATFTSTIVTNLKFSKEATNLSGFNRFYALSPVWFNTTGVLVATIVGVSVSLITTSYRKFVSHKKSKYIVGINKNLKNNAEEIEIIKF